MNKSNGGRNSNTTLDWTSRVMQEACQSSSWESLLDAVELRIKKSKSLTKRFSEYTEYEQAVIVEQEIKNLELENSSSLTSFGRCLKDVVDEDLIEHIGSFKSNQDSTNVERLMNFSSAAIVEVLDKSPPELFTTMKMFLNRRLPDTLRPYIWSYCLQMKTGAVDVVPSSRISPSLDMFLSRRCHILIDRHFPDITSRAFAGLIKSVVTAFMRRNHMPLPGDSTKDSPEVLSLEDDDIEENGATATTASLVKSSSEASSCQMYDRLIFLAVPLAVIIKDGMDIPSVSSSLSSFDSPSAFESGSKPQVLAEIALQDMAGVKHLAVLSEDDRVNFNSVYLGYTQSLIKIKHPMLHQHLMSLTGVGVSSITNPFYDFLNESLLRGLSGLLNLDTCQFVWDQCFVVGFTKMLPLISASLVLGCAQELLGIDNENSVVDSWVSYCHHCSVESIQRLLSTQCAPELFDLFDKSSTYVLDYNEDDDMLLQVVVDKLNPDTRDSSIQSPTLSPKRSLEEPINHDVKSTIPVSDSTSLTNNDQKISSSSPPATISPKSPRGRPNPFLRKLSGIPGSDVAKVEEKTAGDQDTLAITSEVQDEEKNGDTIDDSKTDKSGENKSDDAKQEDADESEPEDKKVSPVVDEKETTPADKDAALSESSSTEKVGDKSDVEVAKPKKSKKSWFGR